MRWVRYFALHVFFLLTVGVFTIIEVDAAAGTVTLFSDSFAAAGGQWSEVYLEGAGGGSYEISDGRLVIETTGGARYGLYNRQAVSGHFYAEAEFEADEHVALALIHEKDGQPDLANYTMLCVDRNAQGVVVVRVRDRQQGKADVLDNTGKLLPWNERRRGRFKNADTYEHVLTGKQYSVPFDRTNGKIRIFHDGPAGFFHFYYGVEKKIRGKLAEGWMEVAPSKDWAEPGQKFFVAAVACSDGKAVFKNVRAVQKPTADQDDTNTGFKAIRREYNWSGFFGDAVVVTFDEKFKYHDKDIKCVFWSEMNYVPAWHLNNQLLYTYEFLETWGGGNPGCHEPMSDRLLRWSSVEIIEDNPVRKVVHWHYVLCDPDYKVPDDDKGTQLPEADEYWTFYPDGSGTRYIVYTPKLDTDFRAPHEVGELIAIAGSSSHCSDHFDSPALTLMNLDGQIEDFHPGPKFDFGSPRDKWKQMIMTAHFKDAPDVFCAISNDPKYPQTYSGYNVHYQNTWHNVNGILVHWPVGKRPYTGNNGSRGFWRGEVSHACLLSFDIHDGQSWQDHYKLDKRGRKYRDWVSLIGLNELRDFNSLARKTKSWLSPGVVTMLDDSSRFLRNDYREKALVFENTKANQKCVFEIDPTAEDSVLINPVLRISKWGTTLARAVKLDGRDLPPDRYRQHVFGNGDLLIWIEAVIESGSTVTVD